MKIQSVETTKEGIKAYVEDAAEAFKQGSKQAHHKLAVANFWLDMLGVDDDKSRNAAIKQWAKTPSAFGCNDSQLQQVLEMRKAGKKPTGLEAFTMEDGDEADEADSPAAEKAA